MLPGRAIETLLLAVELDELAESLDEGVAHLIALPVTESRFVDAYVEAGTRPGVSGRSRSSMRSGGRWTDWRAYRCWHRCLG